MNALQAISAVLRKELVESVRDRKATLNTLLLGPILIPILLLGLVWFTASSQMEKVEATLEVSVVGAELAPNLIQFLRQQEVEILPPPDDPEEAVRSQTLPLVLRIPEEFSAQWAAGTPAEIELLNDSSRRESSIPVQRLEGLLHQYSRKIGTLRLQLRGVSPTATVPILVSDVDLSTPKSRGVLLFVFLPYALMITAFTGGLHHAIDSTAGEKERCSLEPLVINPIPRWQILLGKMLATACFGLLSLLLTLVTFSVVLPQIPAGALGADLTFGVAQWFRVLVVVGPVAILASSMLILLASWAKTYREAQSYVSLVILIPMIPSMMLMSNPIKAETWHMAIPMFSHNLLVAEVARGEPLSGLWWLIATMSTGVLAALFALVAIWAFSRPKMIFADTE